MSDDSNEPALRYAQIASRRLSRLLDETGYALDLFGRSNALSKVLETSPQVALQVLSGQVPWSWVTLDKLCTALVKSPSYFLDPLPGSSLPSDVEVVVSATGGENLVWRLPSGLSGQDATLGRQLRYIQCQLPNSVINFVVYVETEVKFEQLRVGDRYVIEDASGLTAGELRSVNKTEGIAVFCDDSVQPTTRIVRVQNEHLDSPDEDRDAQPRIVGEIVGIVVPRIRSF